MKEAKASNGANLGFEAKLWTAADKLRNLKDDATLQARAIFTRLMSFISQVLMLICVTYGQLGFL